MKVDDSITEALRHKTPLPDKLEVLRETTKAILLDRGNPDTAKLTAFFDAGYSKQQLLEEVRIVHGRCPSGQQGGRATGSSLPSRPATCATLTR